MKLKFVKIFMPVLLVVIVLCFVQSAFAGADYSPMLTRATLMDLFWRVLNFAALAFILVYFLGKPIVSGLSGRQKGVKEELADFENKRDEAERSYKGFESRLAGMEKEMASIVENAMTFAEIEKVRILKEAEQAAENIKRQAEAAIQAGLADAKRKIRDEVAEQAAAMTEELLVKKLTSDDQVAITKRYLERVGVAQ